VSGVHLIPLRFHVRQNMIIQNWVGGASLLLRQTEEVDNPFLLKALNEITSNDIGLQMRGQMVPIDPEALQIIDTETEA
jgi:hypothetical protein